MQRSERDERGSARETDHDHARRVGETELPFRFRERRLDALRGLRGARALAHAFDGLDDLGRTEARERIAFIREMLEDVRADPAPAAVARHEHDEVTVVPR